MTDVRLKNNGKARNAAIALKIVAYVLLGFSALTTLFPYLWMVLASFKSGIEISTHPEIIFPQNPNFSAYKRAFKELDLLLGIRNTLILEVFSITLPPLVSALGAFAFSHLALPAKRVLLLTLLS